MEVTKIKKDSLSSVNGSQIKAQKCIDAGRVCTLQLLIVMHWHFDKTSFLCACADARAGDTYQIDIKTIPHSLSKFAWQLSQEWQ